MRKLASGILTVAVFFMVVGSCSEEELVADGVGDAFIVARRSGEGSGIVYGLALHAFGNKSFSKVTAKLPDNATRELSSYNGYTYDFYNETPEAEFTATPPGKGNYEFSFSFVGGETDTDTDVLGDQVLAPATITSCAWDAANARIAVEWTKPDQADYFVISLVDPEGNVVFTSEALGTSKVSHEISATTSHWYELPRNGVTYKVILDAFMYESNEAHLNIQAKSITSAAVVWGVAAS